MSNVIKGIRNLRGFTQEELAAKIGMATRTFCRKESNPGSFTVEEIRMLAEALNVKEEIFFKKELTLTVS